MATVFPSLLLLLLAAAAATWLAHLHLQHEVERRVAALEERITENLCHAMRRRERALALDLDTRMDRVKNQATGEVLDFVLAMRPNLVQAFPRPVRGHTTPARSFESTTMDAAPAPDPASRPHSLPG